MAIPNRQIGWSNESNLLWNISSQLDRLTKVIANLSPGGGTNIYNSNGTLTGNRELSGAGNELKFKDVNQFYVQTSAFNTGQFAITDTEFKTIYNTNVIGLKLDFANTIYQFGQIAGGNNNFIEIDDLNERLIYQNLNLGKTGLSIDLSNNTGFIGDGNGYGTGGFIAYSQTNAQICGGTNNNVRLIVDDFNNLIETTNAGNNIGLKLDFANNYYSIGEPFFNNGTFIELSGQNKYIGIYAGEQGTGNGTSIILDDIQSLIKTKYQFVDIGLKLDFAASTYQFGQITGGNTTYLTIDDAADFARFFNAGAEIGLGLEFTNRLYSLGDYAGNFNQSLISVDDLNGVITLAASNGVQNIAIGLDTNNNYPISVNGTNISANTAGAASGQFLKIRVGGVDYKIALLNP